MNTPSVMRVSRSIGQTTVAFVLLALISLMCLSTAGCPGTPPPTGAEKIITQLSELSKQPCASQAQKDAAKLLTKRIERLLDAARDKTTTEALMAAYNTASNFQLIIEMLPPCV